MDLYRYFHPHHNPRLKNTSIRLQELGELGQAAVELKRALERAQIRATNRPSGGIRQEHFEDMLTAMDYVVDTMTTLTKAHPGDDHDEMAQLLKERQSAPGWENWTRLLRQRLNILDQYRIDPIAGESRPAVASSK